MILKLLLRHLFRLYFLQRPRYRQSFAGPIAKKVWDIWRSVPHTTRQDNIDELCDAQYEEDIERCRYLSNKGDKQKAALCYETAANRMAKCRKDGSVDDLPPLTK